MDAQNAVESASTKQPAPASPKRGAEESSRDAKSNNTAIITATSNTSNTQPINNVKSAAVNDHSSITARDSTRLVTNLSNPRDDNDAGPDPNSDAETIVLPGKDGISPSKPRKVIKHEDKSDGEVDGTLPAFKKSTKDGRGNDRNGNGSGGPTDDDEVPSTLSKKNRLLEHERQPRSKDNSSGLSSAPPSPPVHHRRNESQQSSHRRRKSGDAHSESGSEASKPRPQNRVPLKDKSKSVDRLLPGKRKAPKVESDDEGESRKARRPRMSDTSLESIREKENKTSSTLGRHQDKHSSRNRSPSPSLQERTHRRSLSTQLPAQSSANGFSSKKRRVPAPLQATDYNSDDSSAGSSPHPRSSKLKNIATPLTGDSTISPAKIAPHKKHVDNHGQTLFAKACAKGEYETAKKRLAERPDDLNFADYAGNTPLQVAALNGHENIVKLLIEAGCKLDCRNSDKDTPLLDAVENGHLGVVKLLLEAGVNPRKADAEGHEPLDKVPEDLDNAEEIRAALREAKEKMGELRRTSEDHQPQDIQDTVSSHGAESPRRSPPASASNTLAVQRRGGTVRSTKTSNHLLYMSLDEKTLRQAAARGDEETVTRVLLVREGCNDPEALVNAARGGHDVVMELLLALGGADPDPSPVSGLPLQYGTPMLAAIGQENTKCIKLLLNQNAFDPTRRFQRETYYEIARRREGPMWKEEEHMLKEAYDARKKASKGSSKNKSPGRRDRETETESRRAVRNSDGSRPPRRGPSSPTREAESNKRHGSSKFSVSPKEKRRSSSFGNNDEQVSPRRGPGRPRKEDRAGSDREHSPVTTKVPPSKPKRAESDLVAGSSDGEAMKPRRKLISGKDLKGEREKQRRASMVSNNSTVDRTDSRNDDVLEKSRSDRLSEKYHDRTKALKRDESRDRLLVGDGSGKRPRSSVTPPRHGPTDKEENEAPIKRRKLESDSREKRHLQTSSPDRKHKRDVSREPTKRPKPQESDRKESSKAKKLDRDRREFDKASPSEKASITVFSEKLDVEMHDAPPTASSESNRDQIEKERREAEKREAELAAEEAKKLEERRRREAELRRREEEEKRQREAEEKKRLEEEEKKRREAEEKRRREEDERARLEEEQRQKEEQERKRLEEEERRRKEEEEARRREQEERERRIREAAEEARRLREEEERKERERKRAAREAEREAELLRIRQEQERIRLSKLPPLLRWLECCLNPKQTELAKLFAIAQGVRYDTIKPEATGTTEGREQWLLNTQVALLLGEKDLSLSRCKYSKTCTRLPG